MSKDDDTYTILAGPALYWRFNDTVHGRVDRKHDFLDRQGGIDHGNGDIFRLGIGFVFRRSLRRAMKPGDMEVLYCEKSRLA